MSLKNQTNSGCPRVGLYAASVNKLKKQIELVVDMNSYSFERKNSSLYSSHFIISFLVINSFGIAS